MSPMRKQQLHVRYRYALNRIEISYVSILVACHQFIKQQSIYILCAKRMQYFREVFYI